MPKRDGVRDAKRMQAVMEALGHPSRRQILLIIRLRGDEMTAGAVADRFRIAWPTVTRHLAVLVKAGLLECRKAGRMRSYRVNAGPLGLVREWLEFFESQRRARPPAWAGLGFGRMRNAIKPGEDGE